ncbi:hypothetical protein Tco_1380344, partial [Tanacetum coccineum]
SVRLLQKFQQDDLESSRGMMRLICKTQLKVQLPIVLERAEIFQKNGIDPIKYTITLAHGLSLDVDDPVDVALAYREKMFSQKPSTSSMDNSKRIDDSTKKYSLFEVNYDGMFNERPLSHGKLALMTSDESCSWKKEQSLSPLLRTQPLKKRRKGIAFQGKNLYADFLHADCVDDHFDVLDNWSYEDVYGGG